MAELDGQHRGEYPDDDVDRPEPVLVGFVAELARLPAVVARLLHEHGPDAQGRCRTCRSGGDGSGLVWSPCRLLRLATAAHALAAGRPADESSATRANGRTSASLPRPPHATSPRWSPRPGAGSGR